MESSLIDTETLRIILGLLPPLLKDCKGHLYKFSESKCLWEFYHKRKLYSDLCRILGKIELRNNANIRDISHEIIKCAGLSGGFNDHSELIPIKNKLVVSTGTQFGTELSARERTPQDMFISEMNIEIPKNDQDPLSGILSGMFEEISCGNKDLIRYIMGSIGYILSNKNLGPRIFIFHATKDNKFQLNYSIEPENKVRSITNELLASFLTIVMRQYVSGEKSKNKRLNTRVILSRIPYGGTITKKTINLIDQNPCIKYIFFSDHYPVINSKKSGERSDIVYIPVPGKIYMNSAKERERIDGWEKIYPFMAWKCLELAIKDGFLPGSFADDFESLYEYNYGDDSVTGFIRERCIIDYECSHDVYNLYLAYKAYCSNNFIISLTRSDFLSVLREKHGINIEKKVRAIGIEVILDIDDDHFDQHINFEESTKFLIELSGKKEVINFEITESL